MADVILRGGSYLLFWLLHYNDYDSYRMYCRTDKLKHFDSETKSLIFIMLLNIYENASALITLDGLIIFWNN